MSELPLFVFGTLRRGEANHHCLAGRYERCLPAQLAGFRRTVARHGFPAIVREAGGTVDGELFFLCPETYATTLRICDDLEDIPPGATAGAFYRRLAVTVQTATGPYRAWVYADPATPD